MISATPGDSNSSTKGPSETGLSSVDGAGEAGERRFYPRDFRDIDELVETCWDLVRYEVGRRGYAPDEVKIHMALAEAVLNAWKHGNRRRADLPITFAWNFTNGFTIEVKDAGTGFNFHDLPDPTHGEQLTAEGGRGIFIIKAFAHSMGWRDHGRHLVITFARP